MKIKKSFEMITTDGKIGSFKLISLLLDSNLAKIALVAINVVLAWVLNGFQIGGFFGLIGMAFLTVALVIAEVFLTAVAGIAEICAEIIADCIAPRPEGLSFGIDPKFASTTTTIRIDAQSKGVSSTPETLDRKPVAQPAVQSTTSPIQVAANPKAPAATRANSKGSLSVVKDDMAIKAFAKQRDYNIPEIKMCDIPVHCIREYKRMQQARGIEVYAIEAFWIWYALTDLMLDAFEGSIVRGEFCQNSLKAMFLDLPEDTEDFTYESIAQGYAWFVEGVCQLQKDRIAQNLPRQSKLECYLDTIGQRFNRTCDAQRQADLSMCFLATLDVARDEMGN